MTLLSATSKITFSTYLYLMKRLYHMLINANNECSFKFSLFEKAKQEDIDLKLIIILINIRPQYSQGQRLVCVRYLSWFTHGAG